MQVLTTPRLLLRPYRDEDAQALLELLADPAVMRHALEGEPFTPQRFERFAHDELLPGRTRDLGSGTLVERAPAEDREGAIVGTAGLLPCHAPLEGEVEIGFLLARASWGRGYASEIGAALVRHGLVDLALPRIVATVHPDNLGSRRVLERLGFRGKERIRWPGRGERLVLRVEAGPGRLTPGPSDPRTPAPGW